MIEVEEIKKIRCKEIVLQIKLNRTLILFYCRNCGKVSTSLTKMCKCGSEYRETMKVEEIKIEARICQKCGTISSNWWKMEGGPWYVS